VLILFLLMAISRLQAQDKTPYWLLVGLEIPSYTGDLNQYAQFNSGFTLGFRLNHKENLNGQFMLALGTVKGDNRKLDIRPGQEAPNSFFRTPYVEFSYQLHYFVYRTDRLGVYVSQGAGFFRFVPIGENGNNLIDDPRTRAEDETYRNITLALPTKAGVQYIFSNQIGMNLEAGWHNPLTDYLDNISELGESGNDNILFIRLNLMIPLSLKREE